VDSTIICFTKQIRGMTNLLLNVQFLKTISTSYHNKNIFWKIYHFFCFRPWKKI